MNLSRMPADDDRDDETAADAAPRHRLRDRLDRCEGELVRVRRGLDESEIRAEQLERDCAAAEASRAELAKLLVATTALHQTLHRDDVLDALQEILINLIGTEDFAVFEVEPDGELSLAASFGGDRDARLTDAQPVRDVVASGEARLAPAGADGPAACVPLAVDGRVTGALAVYTLLPQKQGFEAFDHELFGLLATHAATALYAARLHGAAREGVFA
ncbi:MAG TPA: GAF domain-containing protein [Longimicrobium sp.]|nr:GAF domain-containing protein [Longimicrobium sp.]